MRPVTLVFLLLCACLSCNTAEQKPDTAISGGTVHERAGTTGLVRTEQPVPLGGCYEMVLKQDTARLRLQISDTAVSGQLVYHWHERDWNEGTISGVIRDSLILADYTFQSEGMTSIREVIFRIEDSTLVEAHGELTQKDGKVVFANRSSLQFLEQNPFIRIDCPF